MNPERLRAGKAVEKTGQPPPLPGSSERTKSPAGTEESQKSSNPQRELRAKIPRILFEGDGAPKTVEPRVTQKFELGATRQVESPKQELAKLPEAYGTGKLLLTARDPHTLFAHWDLTSEQQRHYNSLSESGRLALRAYAHAFSNQPAVEVRLEPDARHVFLQVKHAGTSYVGELGYYQPDHHWKTLAISGPAAVPIDAPSEDTAVTFAKVPQISAPSQHRRTSPPTTTAKTALSADLSPSIIPVPVPRWPFGSDESEDEPPAQPQSLPADAPPFVKRSQGKQWTALQEHLLAEIIRFSVERREWINSAEIAELVRHELKLPERFAPEIPSLVLSDALLNISSPTGAGPAERKGFWFNINAELIIYGATEPNAQVTVGGRPIKLRPDGTFSCHFALPDGDYDLTAAAISAENEMRQAAMNFRRRTEYSGDVGAHAQNPLLERIPQPE